MKPRALLLCAIGLACAALVPTAAAALRYECRALDGSTHRFEDNPLPRFAALLVECNAIQVSVTEPDAAGPANGPDVVIIGSPHTAWRVEHRDRPGRGRGRGRR